jgi:hypothetical protein
MKRIMLFLLPLLLAAGVAYGANVCCSVNACYPGPTPGGTPPCGPDPWFTWEPGSSCIALATPTSAPTGGTGYAPANWLLNSHVVAAYSSGTSWTIGANVAAATSCGGTAANCNMTNVSMTQDTGTEVAANLPSLKNGGGQYGYCAAATCAALNIAASTTFAWLTFINPTGTGESDQLDTWHGYGGTISSTGGYYSNVIGGTYFAAYACATGSCAGESGGSATADVWVHDLNYYASGVVYKYVNDALQNNDNRAYGTSNATTYNIGGNSGTEYMYETVLYLGAWTEAANGSDETRVSSCGMSGLLCMCDASTHANYKACTTDGDCQAVGNTTAKCNVTVADTTYYHTCSGLHGSLGVTHTLPACDAANPSAGG